MQPRLPHWLRLTLALCAVGVATLALLEVVLRLSVGDAYTTLYRPDPRALYRLAPGREKLIRQPAANGGASVRFAVNRAGFRGQELLRAGAAQRVVVYGDSFIAAEFSSLEESFCEQLESQLTQAREEAIEVVNAGVVGYGPDQVLVRMREDLSELEPDLVILALYPGNDFGDLMRNKLFARGDAGELLENAPRVVGPAARRLRWGHYTPVFYKIIARALSNWSRRPPSDADPEEAAARQLSKWLAARRAEWQSAASGDLAVTHLLRGDTPDIDISTAPESASARDKRALMELVLAAVRDTAARAGVPLLLLIVPSPIDACDDYPLAHVDPGRFPDYRRERGTALLREMAARLEIPHLDLFPHLRQDGSCGLFFPADPHWNAAGQRLAAELAADRIQHAGLLAPPPGRRPAAR